MMEETLLNREEGQERQLPIGGDQPIDPGDRQQEFPAQIEQLSSAPGQGQREDRE